MNTLNAAQTRKPPQQTPQIARAALRRPATAGDEIFLPDNGLAAFAGSRGPPETSLDVLHLKFECDAK